MLNSKYKIAYVLSFVILFLATLASTFGLFSETLYRDNDLIIAAWKGNDLVTLFVVIPLMIISLRGSSKGSNRSHLIWMGTLLYMLYNYMFYLYGAAFNKLFLVYVALFTLSIYALIIALLKTDASNISSQFSKKTPVKWISGFMLFFGTLLGVLWIIMSLSFVFTNKIPQAITQTDHPTGIVFATDLSILIPALIISAIFLLKRKDWGYVFSSMVLIKATTYGMALIAMSVIAKFRTGTGDPMVPLWSFLSLGCFLACFALLKNMKEKI
jgi:hypothetical protein